MVGRVLRQPRLSLPILLIYEGRYRPLQMPRRGFQRRRRTRPMSHPWPTSFGLQHLRTRFVLLKRIVIGYERLDRIVFLLKGVTCDERGEGLPAYPNAIERVSSWLWDGLSWLFLSSPGSMTQVHDLFPHLLSFREPSRSRPKRKLAHAFRTKWLVILRRIRRDGRPGSPRVYRTIINSMPFSCKTLQIPLQCEICRLKSAIISFHAVDPKSQAELTLVILSGLLRVIVQIRINLSIGETQHGLPM